LLDKAPAPGTITTEKENKAIGTTELTLSNGVKVILKSTEFKNDQVIMNASRFGGQYLFDPSKDRFNAEFASTVVGQMGVGQFSPLDLRKVLAGKTATVSPRRAATSRPSKRKRSTPSPRCLPSRAVIANHRATCAR